MTDDLSAPLGQGRGKSGKSKKSEKWAALARLAAMWGLAGALGCFAVVFLGWTLFAEGPLGGEPMVVVAANLHAGCGRPGQQDPSRQTRDTHGRDRSRAAQPLRWPANGDGPPAGPATTAPNTVTIIDGSNGKRQDVPIPGQGADKGAGKPPTDPRFAEASRSGPIPRIAPGRHPPGRRLRAARQGPGGSAERAADRHRGDRAGDQRARHQRCARQAARPGDLRVRALWGRSRSSGGAGARRAGTSSCCRCRWSRSTIRTTIRDRKPC